MDPSYLQMDKKSIGHWWILCPRKDNAGNAFVYQGLGGLSFFSKRSLPVRCKYQFIAFTAPQKTQACRASLRVQPRIARAFSPLPGSDEPSRCFPQFRVDQQSAC